MNGQNPNQTFKIADPIGDALWRWLLPTDSAFRGHPREDQFLLTFSLAGLSEYPAAAKRQWIFENIFAAGLVAGAERGRFSDNIAMESFL